MQSTNHNDMFDMNGEDTTHEDNDYTDSLHYKICQSLNKQPMLLSQFHQDYSANNTGIYFGKTRVEDYETII